MAINHYLADDQLTKSQIESLISLAIEIKNAPHNFNQVMAGKSVAMIF